jgi:hypothetical protein
VQQESSSVMLLIGQRLVVWWRLTDPQQGGEAMKALAMAAAMGMLLAGGASAQMQEECAFDYASFESSVPHFDLDECPDAMEDAEGAFCRASIHMEILSVWVFDDDQTMCFRAVQQFFEDEFEVIIRSGETPG